MQILCMIRTQVRLPDRLYEEAERIADEQEITLAKVVRRGLELMVRVYPPGRAAESPWELLEPLSLGPFLAPPDRWRELANEAPQDER